jgi:hypothetical protein
MTFVAIPSVRHAQIIALTGLDGVIIDCEHGESQSATSINRVQADLQDISATTQCTIVFLPSPPWVFHLSFESEVLLPIYSNEHSTLEHSKSAVKLSGLG